MRFRDFAEVASVVSCITLLVGTWMLFDFLGKMNAKIEFLEQRALHVAESTIEEIDPWFEKTNRILEKIEDKYIIIEYEGE